MMQALKTHPQSAGLIADVNCRTAQQIPFQGSLSLQHALENVVILCAFSVPV